MKACQRTIRNTGWSGGKRKCHRKATHKQTDGLDICEYHYNKWKQKQDKKVGEK